MKGRRCWLLLAAAGLAGGGFLLGRTIDPLLRGLRDAARPLAHRLRGLPPPPRLADYPQRPCPPRHRLIASFGQSNAANHVLPRAGLAVPSNLLQFDWRTGRCHIYREPLLSTDGIGGNVLTPALVNLAAASREAVIVVPFARGLSTVFDWAYGDLSHQHELVLQAMRDAGLRAPVFLWHQGESDAGLPAATAESFRAVPPFGLAEPSGGALGTRRTDYEQALGRVIDRSRAVFPDAWFGVAIATVCAHRNAEGWEPVRQAQRNRARSDRRTFLSADTDRIGTDRRWRYDGCHFTAAGARQVSRQLERSLRRILEAQAEAAASGERRSPDREEGVAESRPEGSDPDGQRN